MRETTGKRLRRIMNDRDLKQVDVLRLCEPYCQKYGKKLAKNDLSQYINDKVQPGQDKLSILGMALGVSEAWLMGFDVPMSPSSPAGSSAPSPGSESSSLVLSDLEQDLIRAFREASPDLRTAACAVLGVKREQGSVMEGSSAS